MSIFIITYEIETNIYIIFKIFWGLIYIVIWIFVEDIVLAQLILYVLYCYRSYILLSFKIYI